MELEDQMVILAALVDQVVVDLLTSVQVVLALLIRDTMVPAHRHKNIVQEVEVALVVLERQEVVFRILEMVVMD